MWCGKGRDKVTISDARLPPPRPLHLLPPQAHTGGRAAVHVEDLAGDEGGGVGGEEGSCGGGVLRVKPILPAGTRVLPSSVVQPGTSK